VKPTATERFSAVFLRSSGFFEGENISHGQETSENENEDRPRFALSEWVVTLSISIMAHSSRLPGGVGNR